MSLGDYLDDLNQARLHRSAAFESIRDVSRRLATQHVAAEQALIEQACERALAEGKYGVMVVRDRIKLVSCAPDARVPYGCIAEVPVTALDDLALNAVGQLF